MTFDERVLRLIRNELARDAETRLDREDGLGDTSVLDQLEDITDKLDDIHQDLIDCCEENNQDPFSRNPKPKDPSEKDGDDDNPFFKWIKDKFKEFLLEQLRKLFQQKDIPGDEYPDFDTWIKEIDPYGGDVIPNWMNPEWYNNLPGIDHGPLIPPQAVPMTPLPGGTPLPLPVPALPMSMLLPLLSYMAAGQANKHVQAKLDQLLSRPITPMGRGASPTDLCCDLIIKTVEREARRTRTHQGFESV